MSELKAYPEYKDGEIKWIGKIPEHWDLVKLKYLVTIRGNSKLHENLPYLGLENIEGKTGKIISMNEGEIDGQSIRFKKNDVLFGKLRPYLAKVTLVDFEGHCSTEFIVLNPKKINENLLMYLMLSSKFISHVNSSTYGTKMPRANWEFIGSTYIPLGTEKQQERIVDYLNHKTSEIDSLISDKERLIELLEEKRQAVITETVTKGLDPDAKIKDSGIEWIGEIPEHWKTSRLSYLTDLRRGPFGGSLKTNTFVKSGYAIYEQRHAIHGDLDSIRYFITENKFKEMRAFEVESDDILLSCSGTIGKSTLIPDEFQPGIINQALLRIRLLNPDLNHYYLKYYMETDLFQTLITDSSHGSAMKNIASINIINKIPVTLPPLPDQEKIVDYLDIYLIEMDQLISMIRHSISNFQEYRESLIYEAVTGKIDVRDYVRETEEVN